MFDFKIIPDGGEPFEVSAKSRDIVQWERRFRSNLGRLQQTMSMSGLTELAFVAAQRQGLFQGDYKSFEDSVDLDLLGDDEDESESEAGPTRTDRSGDL